LNAAFALINDGIYYAVVFVSEDLVLNLHAWGLIVVVSGCY
jgi:hypothetical protein